MADHQSDLGCSEVDLSASVLRTTDDDIALVEDCPWLRLEGGDPEHVLGPLEKAVRRSADSHHL